MPTPTPPPTLTSPSHFSLSDSDPESPPSPKQHFPATLPARPGKSTSYLRSLLHTHKARISILTIFLLLGLGGVIGVAPFVTKVMRRMSDGEAALSPTADIAVPTTTIVALSVVPTPAPTKVMVTQTTMVTMVSTVTGTAEVQFGAVPLPSVATKTVTAAPPKCTGLLGSAVSCAGRGPGVVAGQDRHPKEEEEGGEKGV